MPEKPKPKDELDQNIPPPGDPYEMMYRQYIWLIRRLYIVEQKMTSLEKTWIEILNISKNTALPPMDFNPWEAKPSATAVPSVNPVPPQPILSQPLIKSTPVWEKTESELAKGQTPEKPKKKSQKGKLVIVVIFVIVVILVIMLISLRSSGWSCALPIPGLK